MGGKSEERRIVFITDAKQEDELNFLAHDNGLGTIRELFNNAVALYRWAVRARREGWIIAKVKGSRIVEVDMKSFPPLKK